MLRSLFALNKNRSTVYRYESNDIEKLPTTVLKPLANTLYTTPAYLMDRGTDMSNNSETTTQSENDLLNNYRKLNASGKAKAAEYISDLSDQSKYTSNSDKLT